MQEIYQYENRLIKELEKYYPEVVSRLNYPGDAESIKKIEEEIGEELPESFKKLYQEFNGEDKNLYVGVILGFSLMSAASILEELHLLKEYNVNTVMKSKSEDAISEEEIGKRIIIPFAFDASRCYIALDLTPGQKGKKGQVITLDFDYHSSFLLADSLEEFYDFIIKMMEEKKCQVEIGEEDEEYFEFESGHFFNNLEELLADINKKEEEEIL